MPRWKKCEKGNSKTPGDKSNVTCYNCQAKDHYANKCPLPSTKTTKTDKDNKEDNNQLGMFVGTTHSVSSDEASDEEDTQDAFFDALENKSDDGMFVGTTHSVSSDEISDADAAEELQDNFVDTFKQERDPQEAFDMTNTAKLIPFFEMDIPEDQLETLEPDGDEESMTSMPPLECDTEDEESTKSMPPLEYDMDYEEYDSIDEDGETFNGTILHTDDGWIIHPNLQTDDGWTPQNGGIMVEGSSDDEDSMPGLTQRVFNMDDSSDDEDSTPGLEQRFPNTEDFSDEESSLPELLEKGTYYDDSSDEEDNEDDMPRLENSEAYMRAHTTKDDDLPDSVRNIVDDEEDETMELQGDWIFEDMQLEEEPTAEKDLTSETVWRKCQ